MQPVLDIRCLAAFLSDPTNRCKNQLPGRVESSAKLCQNVASGRLMSGSVQAAEDKMAVMLGRNPLLEAEATSMGCSIDPGARFEVLQNFGF